MSDFTIGEKGKIYCILCKRDFDDSEFDDHEPCKHLDDDKAEEPESLINSEWDCYD